MRYIKPPDFKSVREFQAYYKEIEQEITELLTTDGSAKTAKELNERLNLALNAAVKYLTQKNKEFAKNELPTAFVEGKAAVKEPVKVTAKETAQILEKKGFVYARNSFVEETYIELQTALLGATKGLKKDIDNIIKKLAKENKDTVYNVQQEILKKYRENNIFTVEYSNGAKQPINAYAAMVARSARIESANVGTIGRALQSGTDYVRMTTVTQCCKLCGAYQGKVYCISGKDKRFPSLFDTVLQRKYALPHPNCRHEFVAWYLDMESDEDIQKAIKQSKILYDSKGELVDVRFQKDIKGYAEWQAGNRQRNEEFKQYEAMKAYYESRGEEVPYKTLAGFRRAKRANNLAKNLKLWKNRNKDKKQFERWKEILGDNFPVKTVDEFQKIKYNKNRKLYRSLEKQKNKELLLQEKQRNPKDFVLSKTVQEAEDFISSKAKSVSYKGITNIKSLNQANRTYAYLAEKYRLQKLDEINTNMKHKTAFAEAHGNLLHISKKLANNPKNDEVISSSIGWTKYVEERINTNKENLVTYFSNEKLIKDIYKDLLCCEEWIKYNRHNVCYQDREIETIITHETGHIIAEQKFKHLSSPYMLGGNAEKINNAFKKAKENGDIYNISAYASTNVKEFFAECFAIYEMGIEELPEYIKSMITEVLN